MTETSPPGRILLADDDKVLREGCAALLRAAGHEVITAADGTAAAAALRDATVDLILSDIEMPGMDGLQLLALARDEQPRVPFILVTGHATLDAAITALRRGAADFLQKPVQPAQLRHVVARALDHSRLAEENRSLAQQLESERMKSEFVAIASHEIRTPLAAIKNCLGILLTGAAGPLTPDQDRFLTLADQSLDRLTRLAEDFLDVARLEEGRLALAPEVLDLPHLLEEVADELGTIAAEKRLAVTVINPPAVLRVFADCARLRQVFLNVLHNAIKFSPPGGSIRIDLARRDPGEFPEEQRDRLGENPGPFAEVRITDEGSGIPAGEEERIFERFVQASASLQRAHGGIGLGLPIARGIIELHGGTLWAERLPEGGSRFHAVFPQGATGTEGKGGDGS
jgi:signal transduction histidine kinase